MFTLDDIKAAYAKHGLKPCANDWGCVANNTACPLTVVCFDEVDLRDSGGNATATAARILGVDYCVVQSFRDGVDGYEMLPSYVPNSLEMQSLGKQVRSLYLKGELVCSHSEI